MASVFKRKRKDAKGRIVRAKIWTVNFVDYFNDARGVSTTRQVGGYADKAASIELGRRLEDLAKCRQTGEAIGEDLHRYLRAVPRKVQEKLAQWSLLTPSHGIYGANVLEYLEQYASDLRAGVASRKQSGRPAGEGHIQKATSRIRAIVEVTGIRTFMDISPRAMAEGLQALAVKGKRTKGIGSKTQAHYWGAMFAYLEWARRNRIIHANPLRDAPKPDGKADIRHRRREFTSEEQRKVLQAAMTGEDRFGMSGPARYWLYRLAVETGARANELRKLTRANLRLDGLKPAMTISAASAKSRRERIIPLRPTTAAALAEWLGPQTPATPIFSDMPRPENIVVALRGDLDKAGVAYKDASGAVLDFHSWRVTFASRLVRAGVDVKSAQALLGHATASMTLDVYAKVADGAVREAITKLPEPDEVQPARAVVGGPEPVGALPPKMPPKSVPSRDMSVPLGAASEAPGSNGDTSGRPCKTRHEQHARNKKVTPKCHFSDIPPRGLEPLSPG